MAATTSLENLLKVQTKKLQDLETATDLIQNKSAVQDELSSAYSEVCCIARSIQDLKADVKLMKADNDRCNDLMNVLISLDYRINHMEKNVPPTIEGYFKTDSLKSTTNSQPLDNNKKILSNNNSLNNGISNPKENANNIKNCKKTLFNEPDIPSIVSITLDEFKKIPKYMIGRQTLETLNNLISSINFIIKAKYTTIISGKNMARKKGELDLFLHYKEEQKILGSLEEENTYVFTAEDYEKYIKGKLDKTKLNLLTAIRHCKRLREIRTSKTVHYALIL